MAPGAFAPPATGLCVAGWLDCGQSSEHGLWHHRACPGHPQTARPSPAPASAPPAQAQAAKFYRNRPGCHSKATRTSAAVP